jgi:hypothetical protein
MAFCVKICYVFGDKEFYRKGEEGEKGLRVLVLIKPEPERKTNTKTAPGLYIFFEILIFAVLFALTVLVLRPVQREIQTRMEELRDGLIGGLESYLGRNITYASIGPSIFGALDIRDIRIAGADGGSGGGAEPLLFISRFRVSYSLMALLRKSPQAVRSVRIDRPVLNLDPARDGDFIERVRNLSAPGDFLRSDLLGDFAGMLPERVLFRIRNGRGSLGAGMNRFQARNLNLDIQVEDRRIAVQGRGNAGVSLAGFSREPLTAQVALGISGSFSSGLDEGSARISIPSLSGDLFRFRSLGFSFTLADGALSLRKTSGGDFDFALDYGLTPRDLRVSFNCMNFVLGDFLSFQGSWGQYNPWLNLALSGSASLERDGQGRMSYYTGLAGLVPAATALGGSSFEINIEGDENYADLNRFYFNISRPQETTARKLPPFRGEISAQGGIGLNPLAPNGRISLADVSLTGGGGVTADLSLSTRGREISIFGETLSLGEVRLSAFDALLIPSGGDLSLSLSALRFTGTESYGAARLSSFSLDASMNYEPRQVEASLLLDSFSAADLREMASPFVPEPELSLPVQTVLEDLAVTTEIFLTTDFDQILYNVPRFVAAYEGPQDIVGLFSVSGTDQRFDLTEGRIIWAGAGAMVNGYADFSAPGELNFSLMANYQDISYVVEGLMDPRSLDIRGSYGLRASFNAGGGGAFSGTIEAADFPIPFRGQNARLNLQSFLRYESPRFWAFNLDRFEILDLFTPASPGAVFRLSGGLDQDGALFPEIAFDDSKGPLRGKALITWEEDFSGLMGTLVMEDEQGEERYDMNAVYENRNFELRLSLFQAQLGRVMTDSYKALANGDVKVSWTSGDSFRADINMVSLSGRFQDAEFRASARAELDPAEFFLRDLNLNLGGLNASVPLFRVNRAEAWAEGGTVIRGASAGRSLDLAFTLDAGFGPSRSWLDFSRSLESLRGAIHVSEARLDALSSGEAFDFRFSREGPVLSLSGGPRDMLRLQIDGNGDFYAGLSSPSPIRGSITGALTPKTIDAQTSDLYVDLKSLWNFIPANTDVVFSGGYISAELEIRGPLGDPEFFGRARGNSLRIQVPNYISSEILPIPFFVAIEGNEMAFGPVPAAVGGGAGTITGWFLFDRWIPNTFNLDIHVPPETPIPFDFDITGFLARGLTSGNLKLSMEDMVFDIRGNLTADETEMSLNTDEIAQGTDMFADIRRPVVVDITVTTGRKVEFVYPNAEFPMLQASADMGTRVSVSTDTLARRFSLNSDVRIRSGEIFYFERSFYIREGLLTFRENEIQFDPRISARAETRDRTNEGPVTIYMIAENAPLLSFNARFESTPPLSQMEILALLGQNFTGVRVDGAGSGSGQRALINSPIDLLAQFSVVRRLERSIREFLRLDMFSFRTQMFQNAVFQATGLQNPVDRIGRVGNYFDNTTVFLGKYIGRDMFVQGMLSMRYDENKTTLGGLIFEPDLGVELESPLFSVRWDFTPTHPENWYMSDNSITLTWTRSF